MKLQVSKTNTPNWREITVKSELPSKLKDLEELSKNLWWVWNSEGKNLFHDIDPDLWRATGENPVLMLQKIDHDRYEEIMNDEAMMARINSVVKSFNNYMSQPMRTDVPSIAYFSMEYGLCACLKIYSGGLGILAGDYIKQASDSRVDMTAVGFLYKHGYFTQTLSVDGQQMANYEPQNFNQLPIEPVLDENGSQIVLEVPYPGRVIYANIWKVNVGRMNLYLLDTDNDKNSEFDRPITSQLYGGDWENRIKQEYMLGIGGVLMLKRLGIKTQLYHCNEGHAALLNLQRLVDYVQEEKFEIEEENSKSVNKNFKFNDDKSCSEKNKIFSKPDFQEKVFIRLTNYVEISKKGISENALLALRRTAVFLNPEYFKKLKMHLPLYNIPRYIDCSKNSVQFT